MSLKPILNLATALAALGFVVLGVAASAPGGVSPDPVSTIASR